MTVSKTIRLGYNSGATGLTANVYADDGTLINASPLTVTESSQPGKYTFVLTDAVAGVLTTYSVNLIRGGGVVGVWYADLIETAGTYKTFDGPTPLQNATAVATTLFVDGVANQLKVNSDHTVAVDSSAIVSGVVLAIEAATLDVNVVEWLGQDVGPTIPTVVPVDGTKPNLLKIKRGDTISLPISLGVDISTWTTLRFTAKKSPTSDSDDQSVIQVVSGTGLRVLNRSLTGFNAAWGSISVEDASKGEVTLHLSNQASLLLGVQTLQWDFQWSFSGGNDTPKEGQLNITIDVTQAIN